MVALAVVVALGFAGAAVHMSTSPVSRRRVESFARRQRLTITVANGPLVVRSLALTRRWRSFGLWTGLACGVLWAAKDAELTINVAAAFLGWFVGAVVAEWRTAGLPRGEGRRMAFLERRTVSGYLNVGARTLMVLALVVLGTSFVAVVVMAGTSETAVMSRALVWAGATIAGLVLVGLTLRRVVTRPQPPTAPDLLAADDALRARAATVLAGSVIAAAGLPTATMFELIGTLIDGDGGDWAPVGLAIMLLNMVVGFVVATTPTQVRRPAPSDTVAATQ